MKKIIFAAINLLFLNAYAQAPEQNKSVPPTMVQFLDEIEALQPLMVSKSAFSNPKNEFNIQTRLDHLAEISKQLSHEQRLSTPFFKVMTEILPLHLSELKDSFKAKDKEHARNMLNATLDGCSSCHSQVAGKNSHLWKFSPDTIKGTNFEKAEFLFAVRQYDEALPLYKKVVEQFKPTSVTPITQDVQDAIYKKQSILIRSKRDLVEAQKEIEKDLGKGSLPEPIKELLRNNLSSVKELQKMNAPDPVKSKSKDVEMYAANTLSRMMGRGWIANRNAVPQMYVSSVLYDFVQSHPVQDIGPGVYYWLAKCESKTTSSYYFPLAELYLKECIERYPLSMEAKFCFDELEQKTMPDNTAWK